MRSRPSRRTLLAAALAPGAAGMSNRVSAQEIYTGFLSRAALGGYDPVAYFLQGRPQEGSSAFTLEWKGATWRFASAANRDLFRSDPERYAPRYGGHCAWATARGYRAKGDPLHWEIVDGRLYLNYDAKVHADWRKDIPGEIARAEANWPKLLAD